MEVWMIMPPIVAEPMVAVVPIIVPTIVPIVVDVGPVVVSQVAPLIPIVDMSRSVAGKAIVAGTQWPIAVSRQKWSIAATGSRRERRRSVTATRTVAGA
jgi:hypothetical protein